MTKTHSGWEWKTVLKIATAINLCAGACSFAGLLCHLWNCQSSKRQNQAQFCFCRAAYIQLEVHPSGNAGRCADLLAFQFSFSVSPSFLCFVNFIVGRCFDMLMCKEKLRQLRRGRQCLSLEGWSGHSCKFTLFYITASKWHPAFGCLPVPKSLLPSVTTPSLLKLYIEITPLIYIL